MATRIASLVPSATEALFALGLGERVVAVTHECDFPPPARRLPQLTRSVIPAGLPPAEIDSRVRELTGRGEPLYELDEDVLRSLGPDLIVTQALCAVCAVSFEDVRAVAERLPSRPHVVSLDPEGLDEVFADLERLAAAAGARERGTRLRADLERRVTAVREAVAGTPRPHVVALEWLDPPYAGGHWVPEMTSAAGGEEVLGHARRDSRVVSWDEIGAASPEVVVAMPCGLYADEAREQALAARGQLAGLSAHRVFAVDAASTFSRPGPRLVEGIELLAHLLHPERVAAPPRIEWHAIEEELWQSTAPSAP